jgi:hypothetical protein
MISDLEIMKEEAIVTSQILSSICMDKLKKSTKKAFWEELIAYFPLILHGQHRKRKINGTYR